MPPRSQDFTGGTTAPQTLQAVCTRSEIYEGICPDWISKNPSCGLSSFFWAVFSGIPLAQWILNREMATATLLGCWKEGFHPSIGDRTAWLLRRSVYSYIISLCDHWWNPHCHCACFRNWAHFWRRCHSKASRGMNFNECIGLPTWDIPSDGIT